MRFSMPYAVRDLHRETTIARGEQTPARGSGP